MLKDCDAPFYTKLPIDRDTSGFHLPKLSGHLVLKACLFREQARSAAAAGSLESAFSYYRNTLDCLHELNRTTGGQWQSEQDQTNQEYAALILGKQEGELPAPRSSEAAMQVYVCAECSGMVLSEARDVDTCPGCSGTRLTRKGPAAADPDA